MIYLYKSRLSSPKSLFSYLFLEVLPITLSILWHSMESALAFIFLHFGFLILYECGHIDNDRQEFKSCELNYNSKKIIYRVTLFTLVSLSTLYFIPNSSTAIYILCSATILFFFKVHNTIGKCANNNLRNFRVISFSILAQMKYFPAIITLLPAKLAFELIILTFLCHGSGRIVEYSIRKFSTENKGISYNTLFFFANTPLSLFFVFINEFKIELNILYFTYLCFHSAKIVITLARKHS